MTVNSENKNETVQPKVELTGEDITEKKDGGILKQILKEGHGEDRPQPGDNVSVHYTGTLLDGTKFDSSRDRGEKFSFQVGTNSVIKGWDQGIPTMKRGEIAKFIIRSDYGYGDNGSGSIPPKATLVFEVELFDFTGEDISENKDKSIIRRVITQGSGYTNPNDGARVVINLKGYDKSGRVFDKRENVEFEIGEGINHNIIEGIEAALLKFKKDEHSRLEIKSSLAWKSQGNKEFNIPEHTDVVYEVELKSFEKAKESWQLNSSEKLEQSELLKNKGTELFKQGNYVLAAKKYKKIVEFLNNETYDLETDQNTCKKLLTAANLNIAACSLKTKEYRSAIESCTKSLELEPNNEKGLFRMAQAYLGLCEFEDAIKYFNKVLEVSPNNKDATNQLELTKKKLKEYHQNEKALYAKMFKA